MARKTNGGSLFHFNGFFHIVICSAETFRHRLFALQTSMPDFFLGWIRPPFKTNGEMPS
jgi:hypothetical protein